jgi:hypothetical protein
VEQPSAPLQTGDSGDAPVKPFSVAQFSFPYNGPKSGTLKCSGDPVPPNAEYVFPGMPQGNLRIDLDGKPWDARLVPGKGQTQDFDPHKQRLQSAEAMHRALESRSVGESYLSASNVMLVSAVNFL